VPARIGSLEEAEVFDQELLAITIGPDRDRGPAMKNLERGDRGPPTWNVGWPHAIFSSMPV
jgi:hypothetical protein